MLAVFKILSIDKVVFILDRQLASKNSQAARDPTSATSRDASL
jgi:hypothetical protein